MSDGAAEADRPVEGDGPVEGDRLRRSPARLAQGVGVLAALAMIGGFFLTGGGFDGVATTTREVIGTTDTAVSVDGTWVVQGIAYVAAPVGLVAGRNVLAMELPSAGPVHNVVIEQDGIPTTVLQGQAAGRYVATLDLREGELTYWCSVGSHRRSGMEGTLTVGAPG